MDKKRPISVKKWTRAGLFLLFLGIAVYSGLQAAAILSEYQDSQGIYQDLHQHVQRPTDPSRPTTPESITPQATEPVPTESVFVSPVDFEALWAVNPDVVAWITIDGTNVHYPVLQGRDNDIYLHTLIDGTAGRTGSIFMDYRNLPDFSDRNTVIYGHYISDGSMFQNLSKYKRQSFYDEHPTGILYTPQATYEIAFFAGYVSDVHGDAWTLFFDSDEEYRQWLDHALERSLFESGIVPTTDDHVITLSTCSYEFEEARFVLLGILR